MTYNQFMADCTFCKIIAGELPSSVVYRDDVALAFMDINPVTTGHLLVIPLKHSAYLSDMDEETGAHLFRVAMRLQDAIRRSGLRCEGINLFLADGEAAGQEVFHVHLHVFPRYDGDEFKIEADWSVKPPRETLDALAAQIAGGLL
ncbi:MAG: HIT family protein [Chloroflexia bacterium]